MPSKLVTNFSSMFSDLPNYPRQHQISWEVQVPRHHSHGIGYVDYTDNIIHDEVVGRDRAKFFKRPILPNSMPLPYIRYAKEISQSEDDIFLHRQKYKQLFEPESISKPEYKISFGTQTDFREIEVQTDPCTLNYDDDEVVRRRPEVRSLSILRHGRGLPATTNDDLDYVDELRRQRKLEEKLPPTGDPRRPVLEKTILQKRQEIQSSLDQKHSNYRIMNRTRQMSIDVREFSETSSRMLEQRLERMWRQKQAEKDERMKVIRKIHEKEQKSLEKKCRDLNNYIRKGSSKNTYDIQERLTRSAAGQTEISNPPFMDPLLSRPTTGGRFCPKAIDDEFLLTYNGLRALEKSTTAKMANCGVIVRPQVQPKKTSKASSDYVRHRDRYRHNLDKAYDEILAKKSFDKDSNQVDVEQLKKQQLYEFFRVSECESSDNEPEVSSAGRSLHSEAYSAQKKSDIRKEVEKRRIHRKANEKSVTNENGTLAKAENLEKRKADVNAFMDEIEGEALGQMLTYLSSELEGSSTETEHPAKTVDHIYEEIRKVTQSTVDRYLDNILLDTLYRHAGETARRKTEINEAEKRKRCASASDANKSSSPPKVQDDVKCAVGGLQIKQRIMEFQKQHLLAASEALYAVLADMKAQGEDFETNQEEIEETVREALKEICSADNIEQDLRKIIESLNLSKKNKQLDY